MMAVGGHGIISVASNEVPAEMTQMAAAASRGDYQAARRLHAALFPLMQVNFVESSPGPVKCAMAAMGLLEEDYRLPMVPASDASRARIRAVLESMGLLGGSGALDERTGGGDRGAGRGWNGGGQGHGPAGLREAARGALGGRGAGRGTRRLDTDRLAGQHMGQAGHPARVPPRRQRGRFSRSRQLAVLRQGHAAAEAAHHRQQGARGARRLVGTRRRIPRRRRHLHAADVHQHRRLRR